MNYIPTAAIYQINSEYVEERKELHKLIILKKTDTSISKIPSSAVLTAGGSGSGKSFFVEKLFLSSTEEDYVLIDSDNIKEELPEYVAAIEDENLDAADIVHEESGFIAKTLLEYCISRNYSFIYDGTMSNFDKYNTIIEHLKTAKFNISALYVDIDLEVALRRAFTRAKSTGRAVPEDIIRKTNIMSAKTFHRLVPQFDEAIMFNNSKNFSSNIDIDPFALKEINKLKAYNFEEYRLFMEKVES
ncbi:zeta toxin family protein [Sporosarcina luteola]|uniref:zeta toxin family protein n=1 Tax=Sporosarcina luteola TaxID=582850 RepID=UPI00203EDE08|nr:zeta toxin family protein [Sporosarcina luteola]MCM3711957.1 zeta toxin family protein [Sporosarcina luteola]